MVFTFLDSSFLLCFIINSSIGESEERIHKDGVALGEFSFPRLTVVPLSNSFSGDRDRVANTFHFQVFF